MKYYAEFAGDVRKLPRIRPGESDLVAELSQAVNQFDALIIGAPAAQQRVQVQNAERDRLRHAEV